MKDWDRTYREKGATQHGVLPTVELSAQIMSDHSCKEVLDLGCGSGRHTIYLAKSGFTVYGVDRAPHAIEITAERARQEGLKKVFLSVADMTTLPYDSEKFDAVVCVWSTGHGFRKDIVKSIEEMHRVLKPGGILLSDFPSTKDRNFGKGTMLEANTFLHPFLDHPDVPHYYLTRQELSGLLQPLFAPISIQEITYEDPKYNSKMEAFWVQAQRPNQTSGQSQDIPANLG